MLLRYVFSLNLPAYKYLATLVEMVSKSISKSLLNEVGILENLKKQENFVSNSLENKVGIFSNLAFPPPARASLRARIRLRIAASRAGTGLPAR